jgi:hypothetical protein
MKMTSTKRFAVRTALVTSTTLATIVGAQALASLDAATFSSTPQAVVVPAGADSSTPAAAPNIVILRHAGQDSGASNTDSQANASTINSQAIIVQPPNPVQVTVPQPVPQTNAPLVARTRSTR